MDEKSYRELCSLAIEIDKRKKQYYLSTELEPDCAGLLVDSNMQVVAGKGDLQLNETIYDKSLDQVVPPVLVRAYEKVLSGLTDRVNINTDTGTATVRSTNDQKVVVSWKKSTG